MKPERGGMIPTRLDLTGLKCPLPALRTAKALKSLSPGEVLEVHCTDPLAVIDIPNLVQQTGDMIAIIEQSEQRTVFLIEKANRSIDNANAASADGKIND
jgi:tRNA 2-thiouridine synthesizing protein A